MNSFKKGAVNASTTRLILILGIVIVAALAIYMFAGMPDRRSTGERIGDAIDGLPQGVGEATSRLDDQTPLEKAKDAVQDETNN